MDTKQKQMQKLIAIVAAIIILIIIIIIILLKWNDGDKNIEEIKKNLEKAEATIIQLRGTQYDIAEGMKEAIHHATETAKEIYGISEGYHDQKLLDQMNQKYKKIKYFSKEFFSKSGQSSPTELKNIVDSTVYNFNEFINLSDRIEDENIRGAIKKYENSMQANAAQLQNLQDKYDEQTAAIQVAEQERDHYKDLYEQEEQKTKELQENLNQKKEQIDGAQQEFKRIIQQYKDSIQVTTGFNIEEMSEEEILAFFSNQETQRILNKKGLISSAEDQETIKNLAGQLNQLQSEKNKIEEELRYSKLQIQKLKNDLFSEKRKISRFEVYYWKENRKISKIHLDNSTTKTSRFFSRDRDVFVRFELTPDNFSHGEKTKKIILILLDDQKKELEKFEGKVDRNSKDNDYENIGSITIPHRVFKNDKKKVKNNESVTYYIGLIDDENIPLLRKDFKFKLQ